MPVKSRQGTKVRLRKNVTVREENNDSESDSSRAETEERGKPRRSTNVHSLLLEALTPIIEESQHSTAKNEDLLTQAQVVFDNSDKKVFAAVLWRMMIVPFQVKDKSDNVERIIKFFHLMVDKVSKNQKSAIQASLEENPEHQQQNGSIPKERRKELLNHRILRLCEKYHEEGRVQVRVRLVQTIVKICESLDSMDEIEGSLKHALANVLLIRIKDKQHQVRVEAARGLCYFQGGQGCDITLKMMEFIRIDPRPEVRKSLVMSIVLDSDDYGDFLDRCTDVHPEVRRACFHQIREIAFDSISLIDKEKIVQCGLNDSSTAVRAEAVNLIQHWFKVCGNNSLILLHKLDVYNRSKLCLKVLDTLFEEANDENWEKIGTSFLKDKFIPLDELNERKMYLWWYLFYKFSKHAYFAEKLCPAMNEVHAYGVKLMETLKTHDFDDDEAHNLLSLFMKIILYIPLEEGGRVELDKLVREIFKCEKKSVFNMKHLVQLVHKAHPSGCDEILLEIIRDMMEATTISDSIAEKAPIKLNREEEIRALKLKLSTVLHTKHKLMKQKEDFIKNQQFLEAHTTNEKFKELEEEANQIREEINTIETATENAAFEFEEEVLPDATNYSAEAIYFAFSAFLVHLRKVQKISHYVRNFYQAEVMKSIFREENEIRSQVLQIMTTVGFFSHDDACHALVVCIQALLNEQADVKNVALQCIFDLVLKFGFESFEDTPVRGVFTQLEELQLEEPEKVDKMLIQLLTSYLRTSDDAVTLHVTVLGFMKLLIMGRLKAPKIIATLLTFWANSANEGTKIYHDISDGLAMYVQQSSDRAETVARALVPSLAKVMNAPMRSNLRRVDPDKLIGFVTSQTCQTKFVNFSARHMPHQIIAFDILEEIRKRPTSVDNLVYVKALKGLSLNGMSKDDIHELKSKVKSAMREETRSTNLSLNAFGRYLDDLDPELKPLALMTDRESSAENSEVEQENTVDMFQTLQATMASMKPREGQDEVAASDEENAQSDSSGSMDES